MGNFVGRERELKLLEELYLKKEFQMAVIYGRRRVGKTTLINKFLANKRSIYFMAVESSLSENLHMLSQEMWKFMGNETEMPDFTSLDMIFDKLAELSKDEPMIFAIDEYPYLAGTYPAISSILQGYIDHKFKGSKLLLILCGSSMSFMEHQVLGYKSPLYGRRNAQIKVEPLDIWHVRRYFKNYTDEEIMYVYACTGGIPEYLQAFNENMSIDENIKSLFFNSFGRLYEEPSNLLKQELRSPASYNAIISAVAVGYNKLSEIASKVGQPTSGCSVLLASLGELGIIEKISPCGEATTKKTIYRISDQMFRFWYRFVGPNVSMINAGYGDTVYEQKVKPLLNDFCGPVFENVCRAWLIKQNGMLKLPELYSQMGNWWGGNPITKQQEEIDILLRGEKSLIVCECKWRNESIDDKVLEALQRRSALFQYSDKRFFIFSKGAPSPQIKSQLEKEKNIRFIGYKEIIEDTDFQS